MYTDGDGVLEHPGLEAVHICVPTNLHTRYALKAMAQKLAVLLEKPVCLTPEEEAALLQAQGEHQAAVMVGHVVRFFEEYLFLESAVREQRYGPLESLVMHRLSPKPAWGWNNWFEDPAQSGTVLWDLHIHDADFIRYLLGEPKAVRVEGCEGQRGQPVQVVATYDYGTDLLVQAEGTSQCRALSLPDGLPGQLLRGHRGLQQRGYAAIVGIPRGRQGGAPAASRPAARKRRHPGRERGYHPPLLP